ncbi:MAG: undecaprenyl-phosphate glucose phosphotransferase, partial [Phototrophicales bacterium]
VVGMVSAAPPRKEANSLGIPMLGVYADLPFLIDAYAVEQVIIALPEAHRNELIALISACRRGRVDIKVYPDMLAYVSGDISVDEVGGTPLVTVRDIALRGWKLSLKRGLDLVGATVGLVLLSPFLLLTALLIRLESPGPVFYTQERMGLDGRPFQMIKFRSMRQDAEKSGAGWTVKND